MQRQPPAWQPTPEEIEQIKRALRIEAHPPTARSGLGAAVRARTSFRDRTLAGYE